MPKYLIAYTSIVETYVEIEADTLEEAEEEGWMKIDASLCHQCARGIDLSGDWDQCSIEEV